MCSSGEKIHDLRIVKTKNKIGVVALTDFTLHQFWGPAQRALRDVLDHNE